MGHLQCNNSFIVVAYILIMSVEVEAWLYVSETTQTESDWRLTAFGYDDDFMNTVSYVISTQGAYKIILSAL